MTGAMPIEPDMGTTRALLRSARTMGGAHGAMLEICIVTLCLPWEALAIDLEKIDWSRGFVEVPSRRGGARTVALPHVAIKAIMRIAGSAKGSGQAVTAGRGPPLRQFQVRIDRLQDRLADAVPEDTSQIGEWNFHGIRAAGRKALVKAGTSEADADAVLGLHLRVDHDRQERADRSLVAAERWCLLLQADSAAAKRSSTK